MDKTHEEIWNENAELHALYVKGLNWNEGLTLKEIKEIERRSRIADNTFWERNFSKTYDEELTKFLNQDFEGLNEASFIKEQLKKWTKEQEFFKELEFSKFGNKPFYLIQDWINFLHEKKHPQLFQNFDECDHLTNETEQETKRDLEKELSEIRNSKNLFLKGLPMDQVVNHFHLMTVHLNKAGNPYLSIEQFISFLKKGFINDGSQPKQKIDCSNGEKGFVIRRFYEFFILAVSKFGHPNRKIKFINLFTDCFDNWDKDTIEPFFKPGKTKHQW